MTKNSKPGFTIAELIFTILLATFASVLFFVQKNNIQVVANDDKKKIAINAMYYSLEKVFYENNKFYPQEINKDVLPSVDPELFTDPEGNEFNTGNSAYSYSPVDCENNKCKGYTLKAKLKNEVDYKKTSDNS